MFGTIARMRAPEILEVRVHGVLNTPPAEMLETTPDQVRRHIGDDLGSFWRRTEEAPRDGITATEAFSWGAQARTGGGALAAVGRVFVHLGWFLLLPYALANLAYWTRSIRPQKSAGSKTWNGDNGAATVRVFGLLLTLIAVSAFCSVAIDLVAIQCFRDGTQVCAALPTVFDGLRELGRDSRAAVLGLAPILTIVVLYLIGRRGRVRFEERVKRFGAGLGDAPNEEGLPLLATRGFWSISRIGQTSEWLHLAASITLVLFVLALDSAYVQVDHCWRGPSATITSGCIQEGLDHPLPFWFGVGALVLMIAIVILVAFASHTSSKTRTAFKRGAAMVCIILSIAGYTTWTVFTFTPLTPLEGADPGFLGLVATPIALIVLALFLALAGAGWKPRITRGRRAASAVFLVLGAAALLGTHIDAAVWGLKLSSGWEWVLIAVAVICVVSHLLIAWTAPGDRRLQAWRGQGAAVAMILALFSSMALSSLLVLGAASWLGAPAESAGAESIWRIPANPPPADSWNVPDAYERFAVVLTFVAAVMLALVIAAVGWNMVRYIAYSLPPLAWKRRQDDDEGTAEERGGLITPDPRTYAPRLKYPEPEMRRLVGVRRSSHLLHRGEPLFGWLAVLAAVGFFSLASSVVYEAAKDLSVRLNVDPAGIRAASTAVLVAVALAAVAAVAAHAAASDERPLGVFWDVVAFFPRAGHPFAPPCFGERAVPELTARTKSWLNDPAARRPRAVLLTAHSMGSTICAATLLAMRGERIDAGPLKGGQLVDRTAFLSYGTQLRAYFSRFFPSVFGPDVLGVPGLQGPSLWRRDPWRTEVLAEFARPLPPPAHQDDKTLTAMLGAHDQDVPRWRNLWRRTDYLGFPAYAYRSDGNPVDRGATESVSGTYLWQIGTHSNYLGTPQFLLARADLVRAFGGKPD